MNEPSDNDLPNLWDICHEMARSGATDDQIRQHIEGYGLEDDPITDNWIAELFQNLNTIRKTS